MNVGQGIILEANYCGMGRLEKRMKPTSEPTKLEAAGGLKEYKGAGKLKDKKMIITSGE